MNRDTIFIYHRYDDTGVLLHDVILNGKLFIIDEEHYQTALFNLTFKDA